MNPDRAREAARCLQTLANIERETALTPDPPAWLVGLLAGVDPIEVRDLAAELTGDRCDECGQPLAEHLRETGRAMNASWDDNRLHSVKA